MLLYRFDHLKHLVEMIRTGEVSFSHPAQWPDPYECSFLTSGRVVRHMLVKGQDGRFYSNLARRSDSITKSVRTTNYVGRYVFAQCLTSQAESERMWIGSAGRVKWCVDSKAYSAAVAEAVGTRIAALREVKYLPQQEVDALHRQYVEKYSGLLKSSAMKACYDSILDAFSVKRSEFRDELEYRIVVIDTLHEKDQSGHPVQRDRFHLKIEFASLVEDVVLHPSSTDAQMGEAKKELESVGYRGIIRRSALYERPNLDFVTERSIVSDTWM